MNLFVKIILSLLVAVIALSPYLSANGASGALEAVSATGLAGSIALVILFFTAIAFYCKTLQTCLERIKPENRSTSPGSVWYMFLIPYNFIEDFFIIVHVSRSIENERRQRTDLGEAKDPGLVTGLGWCMAQLLSFLPGPEGQVAAVTGLVLWLVHWRSIHRINRLLAPGAISVQNNREERKTGR